jgi:hypothetical protein
MDILLFRLAIASWLIAAIAPIDGTWFAGIGLFVVSVMGGVVMLANLTLGDVTTVADVFGLFNLLMPWYNLIFLWGLFRFASPDLQPWSLRNLLLYGCALHATSVVLAFFVVPSDVSLTVTATGIRWVFAIWASSLLLLALAFLVRCYRLRRFAREE